MYTALLTRYSHANYDTHTGAVSAWPPAADPPMSRIARAVENLFEQMVQPGYRPHMDLARLRVMDISEPPRMGPLAGCDIEAEERNGIETWVVRPRNERTARALLYVHGGGYVSGPNAFQLRMICRICGDVGAVGYVPIYRLAPEHPYPAALSDVMGVYDAISTNGSYQSPAGTENTLAGVTVLGDSAGGGIALSLVNTLRDAGRPRPHRLVLMSPWVDVRLNHPEIEAYQARDRMLWHEGLREAGLAYAGTAPLDHPGISPANDTIGRLPPTLVLLGGHDVLYPDARDWAERARAFNDGTASTLEIVTEPKMFHVWPAMTPFVPEARRAVRAIVRFVTE